MLPAQSPIGPMELSKLSPAEFQLRNDQNRRPDFSYSSIQTYHANHKSVYFGSVSAALLRFGVQKTYEARWPSGGGHPFQPSRVPAEPPWRGSTPPRTSCGASMHVVFSALVRVGLTLASSVLLWDRKCAHLGPPRVLIVGRWCAYHSDFCGVVSCRYFDLHRWLWRY